MKTIAFITTFLVAGLLSGGAVTLNVEGFGAALHGWKKNRTADYSINNNNYRTTQPTVTPTEGGGIFISTRIERVGRYSGGAVAFLELSYSPGGDLMALQIRATIQDKRLDTGLVTPVVEAPVLSEEGAAGPTDPVNPTTRLVMETFNRLDTELSKLDAKEGEKPKRDLFGRLSGRSSGNSDIPAALRHNLNLLLANIGPGSWRSGK